MSRLLHDGDRRPTKRQLDVLTLIARGLNYKAVARELGVEPSTVRTHIALLHARLGSVNAPNAVYIAVTTGLIS